MQALLMSATSWAFMMRPAVPQEPHRRLGYHTGFTLGCITAGSVATFAGYLGAAGLPHPLALGLLFLNAAFFMVLLADSRSGRSEEHTSELQSLMRISYAVFCLKKQKTQAHLNK